MRCKFLFQKKKKIRKVSNLLSANVMISVLRIKKLSAYFKFSRLRVSLLSFVQTLLIKYISSSVLFWV